MTKFIKNLLVFCISMLSFSINPITNVVANERMLDGAMVLVEIYGYCSGSKITTTYSGYIEISSRISSVETRLQIEDNNSSNNSYVIYVYTLSDGTITVPYNEKEFDSDNLFETTGTNLGVCPN